MKIICIVLLQFCFHHSTKCGHFNFNDDEDTNQVNNVDVNSCEFNPKGLSPVIFIPGLGGNKLQAKLNKPTVPHFWCFRTHELFDIWLNPFELMPFIVDCWVDNMKLIYDKVTRKTVSPPGVEIKVPGWGQTETIEWIDTTPVLDYLDFGAYFHYIADALVNLGYVRGETLFGAPYDFRKGPNENGEWFERLAFLTEYIYSINGNIGVTFIAHSLGGRMLLYFLQEMPEEWKDMYVKQVIAISVPWGGSTNTIKALTVGYNMGMDIVDSQKMKEVQVGYPSVVWLLPSEYFWNESDVLAIVNEKNYTLRNIDQFFSDIGNPNLVEIRKDLQPYGSYMAPGVEMHCLFGNSDDGIVDSLNFGQSFNSNPIEVKGDGDGTVNRRSLAGCDYWRNTPAQFGHEIHQQELANAEHYDILSDSRLIDYITKTLFGLEGLTSLKLTRAKRQNVTNHKIMRVRLF